MAIKATTDLKSYPILVWKDFFVFPLLSLQVEKKKTIRLGGQSVFLDVVCVFLKMIWLNVWDQCAGKRATATILLIREPVREMCIINKKAVRPMSQLSVG